MYSYDYKYYDYLCHHGVKGMKWGKRKARSQVYTDAANRTATAKQQYKQAKQAQKEVAKAERNTPEAKAARKAKLKTAAKVGAAAAGTALAVYGGYKLNKYVKTKNCEIAAQRGYDYAEKMFKTEQSMAFKSGLPKGATSATVTINANSGRKALDYARNASRDKFGTAAKNVIDYRKQHGRGSLRNLNSVGALASRSGSSVTFQKRR